MPLAQYSRLVNWLWHHYFTVKQLEAVCEDLHPFSIPFDDWLCCDRIYFGILLFFIVCGSMRGKLHTAAHSQDLVNIERQWNFRMPWKICGQWWLVTSINQIKIESSDCLGTEMGHQGDVFPRCVNLKSYSMSCYQLWYSFTFRKPNLDWTAAANINNLINYS